MPAAPSPAQSESSRLNGARSHGPASDAGRARAAQNATRHGLTARALSLSPEEADVARALRDALLARYLPVDAVELAAIEAIVVAELKSRRLDGLELDAVGGHGEPADASLLRTLDRYRGRVARDAERAIRRLQALIAERPPQAAAGPAQLRRLADLMEPRPAEAAARPGHRPSPVVAAADGPNEPEPGRRGGAAGPLNRHERRRQAALQGRSAAAAVAR